MVKKSSAHSVTEFDDYAYHLYNTQRSTLLDFLSTKQNLFDYRIYTHTETKLCAVYSYYLRQVDHCTPIPTCLRCLAHALRYSKDNYLKSLILKSVVIRYEEGPNLQSIIQRAKNTNPAALYEFGTAIIEAQGIYGVFDTYIQLIKNVPLAVKIQNHPLLHSLIMEDEFLKECLYRRLKERKHLFNEELFAKAYHPSRFMQWCFTEDEKEGMDVPQYNFQNVGSPWNIEWS